ncbi:hypothetical protein ACFL7E_03845 [Thermodesulfobacteriota bacterium]
MKRIVLIVMVSLLCFFSTFSFAYNPKMGSHTIEFYSPGDSKKDRQTLKDLSGVYVVVENIKKNFEHNALSESSIKTAIETQLRSAGIKVLTDSENYMQKELPLLYVILKFLKVTDNHYDYSISVAIARRIFIEVDPTIEVYENSWFIKDEGSGSLGKYRPKLKEMIDRFINAYLSVNPKT